MLTAWFVNYLVNPLGKLEPGNLGVSGSRASAFSWALSSKQQLLAESLFKSAEGRRVLKTVVVFDKRWHKEKTQPSCFWFFCQTKEMGKASVSEMGKMLLLVFISLDLALANCSVILCLNCLLCQVEFANVPAKHKPSLRVNRRHGVVQDSCKG